MGAVCSPALVFLEHSLALVILISRGLSRAETAPASRAIDAVMVANLMIAATINLR